MLRSLSLLFRFALAGAVLAACVHTPPGTSVEIALAKKGELVRLPSTPAPVQTPATSVAAATGNVPVEKTERVAEAFSRGEFCMKTGNDAEAISAFREAVQLDPRFTEAWNNLAALYEKSGQDKEALEAFRKSKTQ